MPYPSTRAGCTRTSAEPNAASKSAPVRGPGQFHTTVQATQLRLPAEPAHEPRVAIEAADAPAVPALVSKVAERSKQYVVTLVARHGSDTQQLGSARRSRGERARVNARFGHLYSIRPQRTSTKKFVTYPAARRDHTTRRPTPPPVQSRCLTRRAACGRAQQVRGGAPREEHRHARPHDQAVDEHNCAIGNTRHRTRASASRPRPPGRDSSSGIACS